MMQTGSTLAQLLQSVEQNGVYVEREIHGFPMTGVDIVLPHVVLLLCLRGSARVMFDMKELSIERNDYGVLMPGHVLRRITCSDDFANLRVIISAEMNSELKTRAFSHDYDKFNYAPKCHLTDVQAKRMMALFETLEAIASHDTDDLQQRRQILLSHMAVSIEFVNYYRREQDREWAESRSAKLYTQFCDLVMEHYRENRNVNFYAGLMDYDARYFSKVFRQFSGGAQFNSSVADYPVTTAEYSAQTIHIS